MRATGDGGHAGADQGRRVRHGPHDRGLTAQRRLQPRAAAMPATMESTRVTPTAPRTRQAPSATSGFTARTAPASRSARVLEEVPAREHRGSRRRGTPAPARRRSADVSTTATSLGAGPARREETPQEGAAHFAAADDEQGACHGRDVTDRSARTAVGAAARPGAAVASAAGAPAVRRGVGQRHRRREVIVDVDHRRAGDAVQLVVVDEARPGPGPPGTRRPRGRG